MSHDRKFDILHEVAESILGLRCIYPSTDRGDIFRKPCEQYSARCMLELSIETNSHGQKRANEFEDIVERVRVIHNGEEKAEILKVLILRYIYLTGVLIVYTDFEIHFSSSLRTISYPRDYYYRFIYKTIDPCH